MSIDLRWNSIRVGLLEYEKQAIDDSYVVRESTLGFKLKWAPDIDWNSTTNKSDTSSEK